MAPTEEEILSKLMPLREQEPGLGKKKLLERLNQENGWDVSSKEFRQIMTSMEETRQRALDAVAKESDVSDGHNSLKALVNSSSLSGSSQAGSEGVVKDRPLQEWPISEENRIDTAPELTQDAWAAQVKYFEESTRIFILYGRGKYNCGITPNSDMQVKIEMSNFYRD